MANFMKYLDRLDATDEQREASLRIHEQYRGDFGRLREGEIDQLLRLVHGQTEQRMSQRQRIGSMLQARSKVMHQIGSLEDRLFNDLSPFLAEFQRVMLPRMRMARERECYATNMTMPMAGGTVDLSSIIDGLKLTGDLRDRVDPLLQGYEIQLTTGIKTLYDARNKMWLQIADSIEDDVVTSDGTSDHRRSASTIMRTTPAAVELASAKSVEAAAEIASLNRHTARAIAAVLPERDAWRFMECFYREAYSNGLDSSSSTCLSFDRILQTEKLTENQRLEIMSIRARFESASMRLMERGADLIDEYRRSPGWSSIGIERLSELRQRLDAVRRSRIELIESTKHSVESLVGTQSSRLLTAAAVMERADRLSREMKEVAADDMLDDSRAADSDALPGPEPLLPGPISRGDALRYGRMLGLTDDALAIVESLVADYQISYDERLATPRRALRETCQRRDAAAILSEAEIDAYIIRVDVARRAVLAVSRHADDRFFDDLRLFMVAEDERANAAIRRVRLTRERDCCRRALSSLGESLENGHGIPVDLIELVVNLRLDPAQLQSLETVLPAYETAMTEGMRSLYEIESTIAREKERLALTLQIANDATLRDAAVARFNRASDQGIRRELAARKTLMELNGATLLRLVDMLPFEMGFRLRQELERKTFPEVYVNPHSATPTIRKVLRLVDLSAEQRREVESIALTYHSEYNEISEKMAALCQGAAERPETLALSTSSDDAGFESSMGKLRFERDELCAATRERLRGVLSTGQAQRVGILDGR